MNGGPRHKHAIVLSGGGAYGAYEVGVMKALFSGDSPATERTPLNASIFSGTSVGSYNAAVMVSRPGEHSADTAEYLESCWLNEIAESPVHCGNGVYRFRANARNFVDGECITNHPLDPFIDLANDTSFFAQDWFNRALAFASSNEPFGRRSIDLVDLSTVISTDPFEEMLRRTVDFGGIRRSDKKVMLATTNMDEGEPRLFENHEMTDEIGYKVIMASSAVPGFFPPVEIGGNIYLDGGITMNTPLRPAVRAGAETLHVIYMDPDVRTIPPERFQSTLNVLDRVIIVTFASTINRDIELASSINRGLNLLAAGQRHENLFFDGEQGRRRRQAKVEEQVESFNQVADQIAERLSKGTRYKKITIHRYHPRQDLGGVLGLLNFARDKAIELIDRGYRDTVEHDCGESGCTLPEGVKRPDLKLMWPTADWEDDADDWEGNDD
ncbi:MAG: patatin-like phospholipase family protein [Acidobacteria bacterium]|nr:patatin-like phospholipase family protein [Acidobacteriota bacterium]